jgi:hypothetical protein
MTRAMMIGGDIMWRAQGNKVQAALASGLALMMAGWVAGAAHADPPTVINVEIDYMVGGNPSHSHRPTQAEINAIIQMFACHGITLNVIIDDPVSHINVLVDGPDSDDFFTVTGPNTWRSIRDANFDHGGGWHYCVFGHDYTAEGSGTGSSGYAEMGGDDILVSLGSFLDQNGVPIGTPFDRAATFAHELGHNLGLAHSGDQDGGTVGVYKPVYPSIMSYQFQLNGVRTQLMCLGLADETSLFKEIDYSNGRLPSVNESVLRETIGVGIHKVDWNCSGGINGGTVAQDLNGQGNWCSAVGMQSVVSDYDDWVNIEDHTFTLLPANLPLVSCITADERALDLQNPANCPVAQPDVTSEACVAGQMIWVDPAYVGTETGTGSQPFNTFLEGYNLALPGSVLHLQPGTMTAPGALVLFKRIVLGGCGGAVVNP